MKFNYKKIVSVFGGVFLLGSTVAAAVLAGGMLPNTFVQGTTDDVAVIHGANAHTMDLTGATDIGNIVSEVIIDNTPTGTGEGDFSDSEGVIEELTLGGSIVDGKILASLTDNKISTLLDDKIYWDDDNSSDNTFNFHEEILIDGVELRTSLDDNDFDGIALINNKGLSYRLVFEEDMDTSLIGDDDADTLYLSILGEEYEIDAMDSNSITVVTSEESVLKVGQSLTVDGKTITVDAIGEDSISVSGIIVDEGRTKRVNGLKVQVDSIFYMSDSDGSLAVVKVGEDITTEYNSGDEFIGEDEDDPEWVWDISNPGQKDGWVGVTYDHKNTRAKDDGVKYIGEGYEFPNSYAAVNFEGTTDVNYEDFEVSFVEDQDLWSATSDDAVHEDVPVVAIEGPNDESIVIAGKETDTLYVRYATNTSGTLVNETNGAIEIFYEDVNRDVSDSIRPRYVSRYALDVNHDKSATTFAQLISDDTTVDLKIEVVDGKATLLLDNGISVTSIKLGGETLSDDAGSLDYLGNSEEDAESTEISIDGTAIGTEDNDVMDYYGSIIKNPEGNADDDRVILSIPSEQVEATISVVGQGNEIVDVNATLPTGSDYVFKDTSVSTVEDKNLIVVGGSCINAVARTLMKESAPLCGEAFTNKTGIGAGQYFIEVFESPYNAEKVAVLVAGYNKEDTAKGVQSILDGTTGIDLTTVGEKVIV